MKQSELLDKINENSSLPQIQEYIKNVISLRGFAEWSVLETMLLLQEETGELAKAIRKSAANMSVDMERIQNYDTVESEAADVFIVLTSLCNQLNIDLFKALKEKEKINCKRTWK